MEKLNKHIKRSTGGQSFVELLIALAFVSIVLVALVSLSTRGLSNTTYSRNSTRATALATELLEWARGERDADWQAFYGRTATSTWCLPSLSWTTNGSRSGSCGSNDGAYVNGERSIFIRSIQFTRIDASTVDAQVTVSWTDNSGTHRSESTTRFTNWRSN